MFPEKAKWSSNNRVEGLFPRNKRHVYYPLNLLVEKAMATHSSTLAWKIPWTEEPGRLQSMRSLRVGHDWATSLSLFVFMHWRRKWQPTPVFLPGESQGREAWWAAFYGVTQSRTRLKRLSSSSVPLSVTCFANVFFHSLGCFFSFLKVSFEAHI